MAELPELTILREQMHTELAGRRIALAEMLQPKCLNVPVKKMVAALTGRRIQRVGRLGKWLVLDLEDQQHLLLNLGMGADLWHYAKGAALPGKYQVRLQLEDGSGFTCRFWWFGHLHLVPAAKLARHKETAKLGPSPLEVSAEQFIQAAHTYPRSTAKSLILDQDKFSGIGNAYAHDILWTAQLHPQRKLESLSDAELTQYHLAVKQVVQRAIEKGGLERDFYRQQGNIQDFEKLYVVGYRQDKPCLRCATPIQKIRTGATATFICPRCQPLPHARQARQRRLRRLSAAT